MALGALTASAQEKVMEVQKTDGTTARTRVAEVSQIRFLTVAEGGQGLLVKTTAGETAAVSFEARPVVTMADGRLTVTSGSADAVSFEIADIAEIIFGDTGDATAITDVKGLALVLQEGGALLRGIPRGVQPRLYDAEGRSLPVPAVRGGVLRLDRSALGRGIFIVKAGRFATKVRL